MKKLIFLLTLIFSVAFAASCAPASDTDVTQSERTVFTEQFDDDDISEDALAYAEENVRERRICIRLTSFRQIL